MTTETTFAVSGDPQAATTLAATTTQNAGGQNTNQESVFLVVGDRAFRDKDAVVTKIAHSEKHIATLEAERKADREARAALEAEVARLKLIADSLNVNTPVSQVVTPTIDKDELVQAVTSKIAMQQNESVRNENLNKAHEEAKAVYGDSYKTKVAEIAKSLGMPISSVDALAKDSPAAFKKMFLPANTTAQGNAHSINAGSGVNTQQLNAKPGDGTRVNVMKLSAADRQAHVQHLLNTIEVDE